MNLDDRTFFRGLRTYNGTSTFSYIKLEIFEKIPEIFHEGNLNEWRLTLLRITRFYVDTFGYNI